MRSRSASEMTSGGDSTSFWPVARTMTPAARMGSASPTEHPPGGDGGARLAGGGAAKLQARHQAEPACLGHRGQRLELREARPEPLPEHARALQQPLALDDRQVLERHRAARRVAVVGEAMAERGAVEQLRD